MDKHAIWSTMTAKPGRDAEAERFLVEEALPPAWCTKRLLVLDRQVASGDCPSSFPDPRKPSVPFKLNQDRRHHIPRQTHKVTNWPAHEAGLRQRGSLTVWFTDEAIEAWAAEPRTTRGRQP